MAANDHRDAALYGRPRGPRHRLAARSHAPAFMTNGHGRRIRTSRPPGPGRSVLWPLLGSALLVGTMLATEMGRLYRVAAQQPGQRFGRTRSSEGPQAAQQARALQPGRGRHASSPWQIPLRGRMHLRLGQAARHDAQDQNRGLASVSTDFMLNLIAYNLIRIPKLLAA